MFERTKILWEEFTAVRRPFAGLPTSASETLKFVVERLSICAADLSREDLRDLIATFNGRSDDVGCLVLDDGRHSEHAAVIFAGDQERFHMLAAAQNLRCKVVYVQDRTSPWYQGSHLLPQLQEFCSIFLRNELGSVPTLLFGQSSGAYAALVASTYLPGSTLVACAPQTFSDAAAKAKIHFVGIRALSAPDNLIDVRRRLQETVDPNSSKTIVIAASELGNPATAHYWMDYLHALNVADLSNISLSVVNSDSHVIVHGRVNLFADLLKHLAAELSAPVSRRAEITREFLGETFAQS